MIIDTKNIHNINNPIIFKNRHEAGQLLAKYLTPYQNNPNALVLSLPRGGVPIGYEIARALQLPLDIFLVRKLAVPNQTELALGAIALNDIIALNQDVIKSLGITHNTIEIIIQRERKELMRRNTLYRRGRSTINLKDRIIILVDDGIATGATIRAAIMAIKTQAPKRIIIAVPIASQYICEDLLDQVDEIVCLHQAKHLLSIGAWYQDFSQLNDEEVMQLLEKS